MGKGNAVVAPPRGGNESNCDMGVLPYKRCSIFKTAFEKEFHPPGWKSEHQGGWELEGDWYKQCLCREKGL